MRIIFGYKLHASMKLTITMLLLAFAASTFGQAIYYDDMIHLVPEKDATIKATGAMKNGLYEVTGYTIKGNHTPACLVHYTDSTLKIREGTWQVFRDGKLSDAGLFHANQPNGLWVGYTLNGLVSDSTFFNNGHATVSESFFYYPDDRLMVATLDDVDHGKFYYADYIGNETVIFSDSLPVDYSHISFSADEEAKYPGGPMAWTRFIVRSIQANIDDFTSKDYGTVLVRFIIDTSGKVSQVTSLNMQGTLLSKIGIEAISKGPAWIPAMKDNQNVQVVRIQPITLVNPDH